MPVTVIEAEPNTVTAVRVPDRDGYAAVQVAAIPTEERKLTKPELGHLKKAGAPASRTLRRVPRRGARGADRRAAHGRAVRAGREGQGLGDLDRQGLSGHDQAPQLRPRPGLARLAQRPRPGFDRRQRRPGPSLQGREDARPDGRQARHPARPRGRRGRRGAQPAAASAAPSRAPRAAPWRCAPMASAALKATDARQAGQDRPARDRLRRGLPREPRARGRARGPRGSPPRHRVDASAAARSR